MSTTDLVLMEVGTLMIFDGLKPHEKGERLQMIKEFYGWTYQQMSEQLAKIPACPKNPKTLISYVSAYKKRHSIEKIEKHIGKELSLGEIRQIESLPNDDMKNVLKFKHEHGLECNALQHMKKSVKEKKPEPFLDYCDIQLERWEKIKSDWKKRFEE